MPATPSEPVEADLEEKIDAALEGEPTSEELRELAVELRYWFTYLERCSEKLERVATSLRDRPSDA